MDVAGLARRVLAARAAARRLTPLTRTETGFTLDAAYDVAQAVLQQRQAAGEIAIGRKIGFTNRSIWPQYNVGAPIWAHLYDQTVRFATRDSGRQSLTGALEPRIEPEIAFKLKRTPPNNATPAQWLGCIEWVAHAYEIVVSPFPHWRFAAPDTVAAFGLHGTLIVGTPLPIAQLPKSIDTLANFKITLHCDGKPMAHGGGAAVLDSPLNTLVHLQALLATQPNAEPLRAGEIISTGTLTDALPIKAGQTWHTTFAGLPLPGLSVEFVQ